ncbi:hypothetical protein A6302_01831 [Methylobrevis pamukkalensis]|uniref:DUF2459 domain-containing protein n=2 Tax=Methylobrevis pamukkalensis TaxID=1439726 RepID=A0A1E3H3W6_9HYPH|nr:hypothetical protein A6302_01831 [Methylobrevis pamukkalensis]
MTKQPVKTTRKSGTKPKKPRGPAAPRTRKPKAAMSALAATGTKGRAILAGLLRWGKRIGLVTAVVVVLAGGATWITARPGNPLLYPPRDGAATITVAVADHGYHAGLIVPTDRLRQFAYTDGHQALIEVSERFLVHRWVEIGWGDEEFYRHVPTVETLELPMALAALFAGERATVLHLAGVAQTPKLAFYKSDVAEIDLSEQGFRVLAARLEESFARGAGGAPVDLGKGLYGDSAFYRATGSYSLLSDCNHWTGRMLNAAGIAVLPVLDTLSLGLMADLRWNAETK